MTNNYTHAYSHVSKVQVTMQMSSNLIPKGKNNELQDRSCSLAGHIPQTDSTYGPGFCVLVEFN